MHLMSFIMFVVFATILQITRVHRLPQKAKRVIRNSAKRPRVGTGTEGWEDTGLSLGDSSPTCTTAAIPTLVPWGLPTPGPPPPSFWLTQMMLSGHLTQVWEMAPFGSDSHAHAVGGAGTWDLSGAGYGKDLWMAHTLMDRTVRHAFFQNYIKVTFT